MRLITKADRQSLRQAWIKGRFTEKYLDIEILCTKRPDDKVLLNIWRGTAGKPYINYLNKMSEHGPISNMFELY